MIEILRLAQNDKYAIIQYKMLYRTQVILAVFSVCLTYKVNGLPKILDSPLIYITVTRLLFYKHLLTVYDIYAIGRILYLSAL